MERAPFTTDEAGEVLAVIVQFVIDADLDISATTPDDVETFALLSSAYRKLLTRAIGVDYDTLSDACKEIRAELVVDEEPQRERAVLQ